MPQLRRLHEDATVRETDLAQLSRIAGGHPSRERFLTELPLDPPEATSDAAGPPARDEDYLILSTIHSAKGQEWNAVYLLNAVDGCLPADLATGSAADIEEVVAAHAVCIGVIATPAAAAQDVCDRLLAAGVTSILNFAPVVLNVPSGVDVRKVDLSIELQILAFHAQRRAIDGMAQEQDWQERRARRQGEREQDAPAALPLGGESGVEAQAVGT